MFGYFSFSVKFYNIATKNKTLMKTRILCFLIIFYSISSFAQSKLVFQAEQKKSFLVSYMNSYEESQIIINEMLEAIGKFIPKPAYQTKFTISFDESIKITKDKNLLTIFVDYQNINLNGDLHYKGFDMSDVLIPAKYEFTASLYGEKNIFLSNFTLPKNKFEFNFNEVKLDFTDTSKIGNNYNFTVNNLKLFYDHSSRKRFNEKASLIDEYFMSDKDIHFLDKQLSAINPNAYENIEETQKKLDDIKIKIDNISSAMFWQALEINKYDPLNVGPLMSGIQESFNDIQKQLNYTLSKAPHLFYDKGVDLYNDKKILEAKTNFEKSLYYQNNYAPSQYYLALIAYNVMNYTESKQQLQKLVKFNNLDDYTHKSAMDLAYTLEWIDLNSAASNLTQKKFEEALTAAAQAETFCKSIPGFTCSDTIELIRKDCYNGIYNQAVLNAENSFKLKKIDKAEGEVNKAIDYQKQNSKYINNSLKADELLGKIKVEQYSILVSKGKDEMALKSYREAFDDFKRAVGLEQIYEVRKDKQLPELIKSSKKEILLIMLIESENEVTSNQLSKARTALKQVMDEQKEYNLISDTKLNQKIETLKKAIFSQECNNAQKDYDSNIALAEAAVLEKQFIKAESFYNQAMQIVKSNYDCSLNDNLAVSGLKSVEKPAHYQKSLNECIDMARDIKYSQSIDSYNKLTTYYNENVKDLNGIQHAALKDFIATFEYGFLLHGITWFTTNGDIETGFSLLKVLRQRNLNKSLCKLQQQSLAVAFALRDFKAGTTQNPKVKVAEYTLNDNWYSFFTKEYLKQIKKMK